MMFGEITIIEESHGISISKLCRESPGTAQAFLCCHTELPMILLAPSLFTIS